MIRFLRHILLLLALATCGNVAYGQEDVRMLAGVDFTTYFDNFEYTGTSLGESGTFFSARLTPKVGIEWDERNSLVIGADLYTDFGNESRFISKARPQLYYRFAAPKVRAYAGIFDRKEMIGYYSELFFSDEARFYENRVQGIMGQYIGQRGYAELSIDWCGMYSAEARERFRVLSAGRYRFLRDNLLYGGYALQVFHFAGSEQIVGSVVDNIIVNPYVGSAFDAFFHFDIKLHAIITMQRDRAVEDKMQYPAGALFQLRMSRWGVYLEEHIYTGRNLMPYYYAAPNPDFATGYGSGLYSGSTMFGTQPYWENGDRSSCTFFDTRIGYSRYFFDDTVKVNAFVAMQSDGAKWGTRQMVELSINLFKGFELGKNKK